MFDLAVLEYHDGLDSPASPQGLRNSSNALGMRRAREAVKEAHDQLVGR